MTPLDILAAVALLIALVAWLESTHRRTAHLPRAPFGTDADSEYSFAYRRDIAELRSLERLTRE